MLVKYIDEIEILVNNMVRLLKKYIGMSILRNRIMFKGVSYSLFLAFETRCRILHPLYYTQ